MSEMGRSLLVGLIVAAILSSSSLARAAASHFAFPFRDAEYLHANEKNGGLAYVPTEVGIGDRVPLVVFLHGVNPAGALHAWLGATGTTDLTTVAATLSRSGTTRPFILAGPSETLHANAGRRMWSDFALDDFVDAVDASLGGRALVARDAVVVVGHSGAGCNPAGGLLRAATSYGDVAPSAVVAIDTCLDAESGRALGAASPEVPVFVSWQRAVWPRPLPLFARAYRDAAVTSGREPIVLREMSGFHGQPHSEIVARTLLELLPQLLPAEVTP